MIKTQLQSTGRTRDKVYDVGKRATTKIYDKGKDIGKKGLMAALNTLSQKNVGGIPTNEETSNSPRKEVSSELKWVQLYQNLYWLFRSIGYTDERQFNLDKIVLEEVLKNKDPQVIRHLL